MCVRVIVHMRVSTDQAASRWRTLRPRGDQRDRNASSDLRFVLAEAEVADERLHLATFERAVSVHVVDVEHGLHPEARRMDRGMDRGRALVSVTSAAYTSQIACPIRTSTSPQPAAPSGRKLVPVSVMTSPCFPLAGETPVISGVDASLYVNVQAAGSLQTLVPMT